MSLSTRGTAGTTTLTQAAARLLTPLKTTAKIAKVPAKKIANVPKRKPKDPLKYMEMDRLEMALFCTPSVYLDCTRPVSVVTQQTSKAECLDLRFTGRAIGFGDSNRMLWETQFDNEMKSIPPALMRSTRRCIITFVDSRGNNIDMPLFHGPWDWRGLIEGQRVTMLAKVGEFAGRLQLNDVTLVPGQYIGKIWTRYSGVPGQFSGEKVEALVRSALAMPSYDASPAAAQLEHASRICASIATGEAGLDEQTLMRQACDYNQPEGQNYPRPQWASMKELFSALHFPISIAQGLQAQMVAKKMTAIAIRAAAMRRHSRPAHPKAPLALDLKAMQSLIGALDVTLTQGQADVANGLFARLCEPTPLTGLLSGDVGTGKTLAYLMPAGAVALAGGQVCILAPTQLLADQIANVASNLFKDQPSITIERVRAGGKIKNPAAILVGTSGLTTVAAKQDYTPQFLICDEQHKLSTITKEKMVGPATHVIEVSATPIPRSLAAALYEGMEIFNLRECPVQKDIRSAVVDHADRSEIVRSIRQTLSRGERVALVYPRVENTSDEVNSVTEGYASMLKAFPDDAVMLHGSMKPEEIATNIGLLRSGERRLAVTSTVLETGIDIPSICMMVVRDADRFGISQLHQLRGRLCRNGGEGDFLMFVNDQATVPQGTLERLDAVAHTQDGYALAEADLVQRGFGELDGDDQSGASQTLFRLVKLKARDFLRNELKTDVDEYTPETQTRQQNRSFAF
jgi:ATP-dependent DNA helicase RecG